MMNLLQLQDRMKGMPDSALNAAASMPGEHQFLAMAEMAERQRIRGAYANQSQQTQPTIAERIQSGNPVAPVESPRADIGGLAAASNRGDMQPALGMYSGGAVPDAYYMAQGGTPPSAQENVVVTAPRNGEPPKPVKKELPNDTAYNKLFGTGAFTEGYIDPARSAIDSANDQLLQRMREFAPQDRISPLLAAQEQERARNAELEKRDRWMALAQAGLGMASGNSSDFLTNVVGGAQSGIGALRAGMSESEKRAAGLQARGDALEKARMEQELANATAMRGASLSGYKGTTDLENAGLQIAGAQYGKDAAIAAEEKMLGRRLSSEEKIAAARNATAILQTRINENGQTARANVEAGLRAQGLSDARVQAFASAHDRIQGDIYNNLFKDGSREPTPTQMAQAARTYASRALSLAQQYRVDPSFVQNNPFALQAAPQESPMPRQPNPNKAAFASGYTPTPVPRD